MAMTIQYASIIVAMCPDRTIGKAQVEKLRVGLGLDHAVTGWKQGDPIEPVGVLYITKDINLLKIARDAHLLTLEVARQNAVHGEPR